jgi:hypothetical protein
MNPSPGNTGGDTGAYATLNWTVPAGQTLAALITGQFVVCLQANQATFGIGIDGNASAQFAQGLMFRMPPGKSFGQLIIDNTANTSSLTVTLGYGSGDFRDSRLISTTPLLQSLTTIADVACAAGAQTQVALQDNNRAYIKICNLLANPLAIRVGDINTGAARGAEVVPGDSIELETTSPVYVWNPHSAAVNVGILVVEA